MKRRRHQRSAHWSASAAASRSANASKHSWKQRTDALPPEVPFALPPLTPLVAAALGGKLAARLAGTTDVAMKLAPIPPLPDPTDPLEVEVAFVDEVGGAVGTACEVDVFVLVEVEIFVELVALPEAVEVTV